MKNLRRNTPDYSIVIPVYYNEGTIKRTVESIKTEVISQQPDLQAEFILVDDGSKDRSYEQLLSIYREYPDMVTVIKLTRNFGQVAAIMAGLAYSRGRCSIIISADCQDPPSLMNEMLSAHFNEGFHIVAGEREGRDESRYRIVTSQLFYRMMRRLSFPTMPKGGFDYVLVSERVRKFLLESSEVNPFFQGQLLWTGFSTKFLGYCRRSREEGKSRWTFVKKLLYLIDGVVSYSFLPIRSLSVVGFLFAFLGFLYAAVVLVTRLTWGLPVTGWAPLMIVTLVLGGVQMIMLGVTGEYLWRILVQVRGRPLYIIDEIHENHAKETQVV